MLAIALATGMACLASARASPISKSQDDAPLAIRLESPRGRLYVGQAIFARAVVVAGRDQPTLTLGEAAGVEMALLGGVEVEPKSSTTIGRATEATNVYRFPLRVVVKRPGAIKLPTIRAEAGGRRGAISPSITVVPVPIAGRPNTFSGGVGRLAASVEARPDSIGLGESFELRLRLDGPGSIATGEPPRAALFGGPNARWRAERLEAESTVDPPSRTFRYRATPDAPGTATIRPLILSTFDPASATFQAVATAAIRVRVVGLPTFDSRSLAPPVATGRDRRLWIAAWCGLAILALAGAGVGYGKWRLRRLAHVEPNAVAARLIARLKTQADGQHAGDAALAALTEFLGRVAGRAPGVLTPQEARHCVLELTGSPEVAEHAARAVAGCDRALYANGGAASTDPAAEAIAVLREMGRIAPRQKPREAPGTA